MDQIVEFAASLLIVRQSAKHLCLHDRGVFAVDWGNWLSGAAWQRDQGGLFPLGPRFYNQQCR